MEYIARLILILEAFIIWLGYPGLTIALFIETFFPPIPAQTMIPFAGVLIGIGQLGFWLTLAAAVLGETTGSIALYLLSRRFGEKQVRRSIRWAGRWLPVNEAQLDSVSVYFRRYSLLMVLLGRLTPSPLARTLVCLVAGISTMRLLPFTLLTLLGSTLSVSALLWVGIYLGENWRVALAALMDRPLWWALTAASVLAALGYSYWRLRPALRLPDESITGENQPLPNNH